MKNNIQSQAMDTNGDGSLSLEDGNGHHWR